MADLPALPKTTSGVFYRRYPHYFTDQNIRVCAKVLKEAAIAEGFLGLDLIRFKSLPCGCREALFRVGPKRSFVTHEVRPDRRY